MKACCDHAGHLNTVGVTNVRASLPPCSAPRRPPCTSSTTCHVFSAHRPAAPSRRFRTIGLEEDPNTRYDEDFTWYGDPNLDVPEEDEEDSQGEAEEGEEEDGDDASGGPATKRYSRALQELLYTAEGYTPDTYTGPLEVLQVPGQGWGVVASEYIEAGELVLLASPLVLVQGQPLRAGLWDRSIPARAPQPLSLSGSASDPAPATSSSSTLSSSSSTAAAGAPHTSALPGAVPLSAVEAVRTAGSTLQQQLVLELTSAVMSDPWAQTVTKLLFGSAQRQQQQQQKQRPPALQQQGVALNVQRKGLNAAFSAGLGQGFGPARSVSKAGSTALQPDAPPPDHLLRLLSKRTAKQGAARDKALQQLQQQLTSQPQHQPSAATGTPQGQQAGQRRRVADNAKASSATSSHRAAPLDRREAGLDSPISVLEQLQSDGGRMLGSLQRVASLNAARELCQDAAAAACRGEPLRPFAGIWPELALLNHSCLPNTLALVVGDRLVLRALRSVLPGEQLTISYLPAEDSLGPPQYRQQLLQGRYGFRCDCERCSAEQAYLGPQGTALATVFRATLDLRTAFETTLLHPPADEGADEANLQERVSTLYTSQALQLLDRLRQLVATAVPVEGPTRDLLMTSAFPIYDLLYACLCLQSRSSPEHLLMLQASAEAVQRVAPGSDLHTLTAARLAALAKGQLGSSSDATREARRACASALTTRYGPLTSLSLAQLMTASAATGGGLEQLRAAQAALATAAGDSRVSGSRQGVTVAGADAGDGARETQAGDAGQEGVDLMLLREQRRLVQEARLAEEAAAVTLVAATPITAPVRSGASKGKGQRGRKSKTANDSSDTAEPAVSQDSSSGNGASTAVQVRARKASSRQVGDESLPPSLPQVTDGGSGEVKRRRGRPRKTSAPASHATPSSGGAEQAVETASRGCETETGLGALSTTGSVAIEGASAGAAKARARRALAAGRIAGAADGVGAGRKRAGKGGKGATVATDNSDKSAEGTADPLDALLDVFSGLGGL